MVASIKNARVYSRDRKDGYYETRQGRRFIVTHQTMTTAVDASATTSWVTTTPTFLFYQSAAAKRYVLSGMRLSQNTTVASAPIHVAIFVDSASRYASGGTSVVPQNVFVDRSSDSLALANVAPLFTFKYMPTASAGTARTTGYDAGYACVFHDIINADITTPTPYSVDFEDEIILGKTGSILIYTWAATAGPKWGGFQFDLVQD